MKALKGVVMINALTEKGLPVTRRTIPIGGDFRESGHR